MTKRVAALAPLLILFCVSRASAQSAPAQPDQRITDIAAASACAKHNWKDRGRAPVGYIKGVALVYAKSFCESKRGVGTAAPIMRQPLQNNGEDALTRYSDDLRAAGVDATSDIERLRAIFTLAIGEGMRESSGNTTEGRDISVEHPTESNAEAGIFQTSFDSFGKSSAFAGLMDQYKARPNACLLETFKEGIRRVITRPVFGSGAGAEYQRFTRACPAFATEYAIILMRINQRHFGPVRRHEAEFFKPCNDMLKQVEAVAVCPP